MRCWPIFYYKNDANMFFFSWRLSSLCKHNRPFSKYCSLVLRLRIEQYVVAILPLSHLEPIFPMGQIHEPVTGSHVTPSLHWHRWLHPRPNVPSVHTVEKRRKKKEDEIVYLAKPYTTHILVSHWKPNLNWLPVLKIELIPNYSNKLNCFEFWLALNFSVRV